MFRLIVGFFGFVFKLLFKGLLIKIYFEFFRLQKNNIEKTSSYKILKKNLAYFLIIFLTVIFILSNIQNKNEVSAATENQISKTIMADLIQNQFSGISSDTEELIEDSYMPSAQVMLDQEKYYLDATMQKQNGLMSDNSSEVDYEPIILNEEAVAVKPKGMANIVTDTSNNDSTQAKRDTIVYYTVQKGDTVSSISSRFGITINTILWANDLASYSLIRPGDSLTILPYSGVIHNVKSGDTISKIASIYNVSEGEIMSTNDLGAILKIGDKIIVPGGSKIRQAVAATPKPAVNTGISIIRDLVKAPDAPAASASSGKMAWPTNGHRITQYYSWSHTGLDIANKTGTPLFAAEAGTVEYSGWSNGYGYNVLINHGGGTKTRYAHASKLFVKAGDSVARGENIAAMGSTGWSTGPHIHFEVIINGKKQNPLNYIK